MILSKPLGSVDFVTPTFAELLVMAHEFVLKIYFFLFRFFLPSKTLRLVTFLSSKHLTRGLALTLIINFYLLLIPISFVHFIRRELLELENSFVLLQIILS